MTAVGRSPAAVRVAGPRRRGRLVEVLLAVLGSCVAAVAMTWPALADPHSTVPGDLGDPLLQAWQVAWDGHALATQPTRWFDSNTFWPFPRTLAFSDALLGYAPAGLLGSGPTAAVLRYDVLVVGAFALCALGAYLLCRQLGVSPWAAAVGAAAFAYPPWRFGQLGHLQVLSGGGVAVAVALLLRAHAAVLRGRRGRWWTALGGWAAAAWQVSLGFGVGIWFGYGLAVLVLLAGARWWWAGRPPLPGRLLVADVVGGVGFVAFSAALAVPYFRVVAAFPSARRSLADVTFFSPPLRALVTVPGTNRLWAGLQTDLRAGLAWPPEMTLALGGTVVVLAVLGLAAGRWSRRARLGAAAAAAALAVLALGTSPFGGVTPYRLLYEVAPGFDSIRTPGRLVQPLSLLLAVLAALGVDRVRRALRRSPIAAALAATSLAALVLAEGAAEVPTPAVPAAPVAFSTLAPPVYVLTPDPLTDTQVMLWSTDGFPAVANGVSGFVPPAYAALRDAAASFPAASAVAALRAYGIRTVVAPVDEYAASPQQLLAAVRTAGLSGQLRGRAVVVDLGPG